MMFFPYLNVHYLCVYTRAARVCARMHTRTCVVCVYVSASARLCVCVCVCARTRGFCMYGLMVASRRILQIHKIVSDKTPS